MSWDKKKFNNFQTTNLFGSTVSEFKHSKLNTNKILIITSLPKYCMLHTCQYVEDFTIPSHLLLKLQELLYPTV